MRAIRRFTVRTVLPQPLSALDRLATNLRWSWHAEYRELFASIDPVIWDEVGHDPVRLLGAVAPERLAELATDTDFLARLTAAAANLDDYLTGDRWYQGLREVPAAIAYFSPEFGITAALPQYSGGLGILAGDHLKSASDLGVPILGVGLLYRHGYFNQSLSRDGWQHEQYPVLDPHNMPLTPLREADGTIATVTVGLPGSVRLTARIWIAQVGRVPLLLLDSDVEGNDPRAREVTDRLYGGNSDHRLAQEMLLGVGGVRALRVYCRITGTGAPEVYHTNEGHAGFLGLERIRELATDSGLDFDAALEAVRAGTVFTTHTPVPAGIDRFGRDQIERHFGGDNALPGLPVDRILALGAETYPGGDPGVFNMAVMGLRLAQRANGVSTLHGAVSRGMFGGLWPGFDAADVPIASITNGVHAESWIDPEAYDLVREKLGRPFTGEASDWENIDRIPDADIWRIRGRLRTKLVEDVRRRVRASWKERGASDAELGWTDEVLDPSVLTIGFARRVPSYKRLTLMLADRDRFKKLLTDPDRPIQLVVAGKAHPADDGGKRFIQELVKFADEEGVRHRIVFLPNYDMAMAQRMVPGVDVWLNNPLRPLEACGTSGMKAALNGVLNLSILDGWWDEWFDGENGWAIPTADGVEDPEYRDRLEAAALYDLLEHTVAPRFYDRGADGLPTRWIEMVRHTLRSLGPKVLASRMVRDYVVKLYAPAASSARVAEADSQAGARELAGWKQRIRQVWGGVQVVHVESSDVGQVAEVGGSLTLRAEIQLGELSVDDVDVQVVHGRVDESDQLTDVRAVSLKSAGTAGAAQLYEGALDLDRTGPFGYTVRVLPRHRLLAAPAELGLVTLPAEPQGTFDGQLR